MRPTCPRLSRPAALVVGIALALHLGGAASAGIVMTERPGAARPTSQPAPPVSPKAAVQAQAITPAAPLKALPLDPAPAPTPTASPAAKPRTTDAPTAAAPKPAPGCPAQPMTFDLADLLVLLDARAYVEPQMVGLTRRYLECAQPGREVNPEQLLGFLKNDKFPLAVKRLVLAKAGATTAPQTLDEGLFLQLTQWVQENQCEECAKEWDLKKNPAALRFALKVQTLREANGAWQGESAPRDIGQGKSFSVRFGLADANQALMIGVGEEITLGQCRQVEMEPTALRLEGCQVVAVNNTAPEDPFAVLTGPGGINTVDTGAGLCADEGIDVGQALTTLNYDTRQGARAALRKFQQDHTELQATGVADPQTCTLLRYEAARATRTAPNGGTQL